MGLIVLQYNPPQTAQSRFVFVPGFGPSRGVHTPQAFRPDSISGSMAQVRDMDGDGYPDHICTPSTVTVITTTPRCSAVNPEDIAVHLNKRGKTNLLHHE